jgi:hypothetical protein
MNNKGREPGIYYGLSNEEYQNDPAISNSDIKRILKSPLEYWTHSWMNPNRPERIVTPAMKQGTALHSYILERDKFFDEYAVLPNKLEIDSEFYELESKKDNFSSNFELPKTKTAKTFKYIGNKTTLKDADYILVKNMADYLDSLPVVSNVFKNGKAEVSIFWRDEETGLMCKCRPDYLTDKYIADYKSINSIDNIAYSIMDGDYYIQQAYYLEGLRRNGVEHENFIFIFQQKDSPHLVRTKTFNEEVEEFGAQLYRYALDVAKKHFDTFGVITWSEDPQNYTSPEYLGFDDLPARVQYKYKF